MGLLWFRRGRAKEAKVEPEPQAPPAAVQARVPLRLRGLLLLNLRPDDGLDAIETAPPLGNTADVIAACHEAAPGIIFSGEGKGLLSGNDHRLTLDLGPGPVVHAVVAEAEGDTALEVLRSLLERQGWRAYAPRAGVFIEGDALDLFALPDDAPPHSRL